MTCDSSIAKTAKITWLRELDDFAPDGKDVGPFDAENAGLECLQGNPRFCQPANQGHVPASEHDRPAPASKLCRQALLIRMWAEELAELEPDSSPARCSGE